MSKPTSECHICHKSFINLKSHMTKSHWTPAAVLAAAPVPAPVPVAVPYVEELDESEPEAESEAEAEPEAEPVPEAAPEAVAKPTVCGTSKVRFTFQQAIDLVKEMPSDKYKMMNGVYLEAVLEHKVLGAVTAVPRTTKDILKQIKAEFPTATKHDINRILYKNNKKLTRKETGPKTAPLWSK